MAFKFHHIGLACFDIEKTIKKYEVLGYHGGKIIWDDVQKVNISFLKAKGMPTIELVSSINDKSPVQKILKKNGVIPYHMCYVTDDLEDSISKLSKEGFIKLFEPVSAPAINGRKIVFMYNTDSGLIELVAE